MVLLLQCILRCREAPKCPCDEQSVKDYKASEEFRKCQLGPGRHGPIVASVLGGAV